MPTIFIIADDAKNLAIFPILDIPSNLCFDHDRILADYFHYRTRGDRPLPKIFT